jgi:(2Fe-2S) ferredoxin
VREQFKRLLHDKGLKGRMRANAAGCLDQCARGVTVVVYPEQVWYEKVRPEDVEEIVDQHLVGGVPVDRLRMK